MSRFLIVNADDFGQSDGINRGVIQAHEQGIVTSASLMVRWPAALEAAAYARARPALAIGLHVDLGEWVQRDGNWVQLYHVPGEVGGELARQLARFRELVGRDPTHVDSHQHVHRKEPVHSALVALAEGLGAPLRFYTDEVSYCGDFYGQIANGDPYYEGIAIETLLEIIASLPSGTTELGCHPGLDDDIESMYRTEREREVEVLCDPRARAALFAAGVGLRSFADLR